MSDLTVNTNQEAFDAVVRHFAKQKHWSGGVGLALYRSASGRRCAIGAILRDSCYTNALEYANIALLVEYRYITIGNVTIDLLSELQHLHDSAKHPTLAAGYKYVLLNPYILEHLEIIADKFELDTAVLTDEYLVAYLESESS